jgi:hypothetical protein
MQSPPINSALNSFVEQVNGNTALNNMGKTYLIFPKSPASLDTDFPDPFSCKEYIFVSPVR